MLILAIYSLRRARTSPLKGPCEGGHRGSLRTPALSLCGFAGICNNAIFMPPSHQPRPTKVPLPLQSRLSTTSETSTQRRYGSAAVSIAAVCSIVSELQREAQAPSVASFQTGSLGHLEGLILQFPWGWDSLVSLTPRSRRLRWKGRPLGYLNWFRRLPPRRQAKYLRRLIGETE